MRKILQITTIVVSILTLYSCDLENIFDDDDEIVSCLEVDITLNNSQNINGYFVGETYKIEYEIFNNCRETYKVFEITKHTSENIFFIEGLPLNTRIDEEKIFYNLIFKPQKIGLNVLEYSIVTDLGTKRFIMNLNVN